MRLSGPCEEAPSDENCGSGTVRPDFRGGKEQISEIGSMPMTLWRYSWDVSILEAFPKRFPFRKEDRESGERLC